MAHIKDCLSIQFNISRNHFLQYYDGTFKRQKRGIAMLGFAFPYCCDLVTNNMYQKVLTEWTVVKH